MARPEAKLGKCPSDTSIGSCRHVCPGFLNSPTHSFFLVSMLIALNYLLLKSVDAAARCSETAGRGRVRGRGPVACGWYAANSPGLSTAVPPYWRDANPAGTQQRGQFRVDLWVHRQSVMGSPAVASLTMVSSSVTTSGVFFSAPGRPPPGRRTRWLAVPIPDCNSRMPPPNGGSAQGQ